MGKRGRPPSNIRKYEMPTNTDPNRQLMTPAEVGRLSAKNSRTIVKIMQLLELKAHPNAESLDKENRIGAKLDRLRSRLNRRLKRCANWSDEKLQSRCPPPDKKRRMECSYKKSYYEQTWLSHPARPGADPRDTVLLSCGSEYSYTNDHNAQLLEKGEILTTVPHVNKSNPARTSTSDPTLYRGKVDEWEYLTEAEIAELERDDPEELKRRRRLDNDHRYYMKRKQEKR